MEEEIAKIFQLPPSNVSTDESTESERDWALSDDDRSARDNGGVEEEAQSRANSEEEEEQVEYGPYPRFTPRSPQPPCSFPPSP